jgi:O-antigen/teichoic acid export membrane protein
MLRYNVDNLVITVYLGLTQVTLYSIGARLISYFIGFMNAALGMFTPVFSEYEARNEFDTITEKFLLITKITGYLSVLVGGMLIMFGRAFIQRWVGAEYLAAYPILVILAVPVILALMQSTSIQLLFGISKHKFFAVTNMAEGILKLILSLALVRTYGITGVALGTAVPMLVFELFVQPVYSCRAINLSVRKYYFGILAPVLLKSTALLAGIWLAVKTLIVPDYAVLLVLIAATLLLFSLVALVTGFSTPERGYFKKIIFSRFAHGGGGAAGVLTK